MFTQRHASLLPESDGESAGPRQYQGPAKATYRVDKVYLARKLNLSGILCPVGNSYEDLEGLR